MRPQQPAVVLGPASRERHAGEPADADPGGTAGVHWGQRGPEPGHVH